MMFRKSVLSLFCLLLLVMVVCKKESPTGPTVVDGSSIQGMWYVVKMEASWNFKEDGVPDVGSDSYTPSGIEEIYMISASEITFYNNDIICYCADPFFYSHSGNNLLGDFFDGTETDSDGTFSWQTTVALNNNQLIFTRTETENYTDITGWEKVTTILNKYTGAFPPADWPKTLCEGDGPSKKALGKLHRSN